MYLAQVMGFIPDIVTKRWRDDYIDCAELNQTSLVYEMIENIFFQKENNKTDFLRFNKYKIHSINYLVRTICVNPITLKKTFLKRPRSLSEIVYESIKNTKNKYLISGSWIIEKNQVLNEMYKHRYCEEL